MNRGSRKNMQRHEAGVEYLTLTMAFEKPCNGTSRSSLLPFGVLGGCDFVDVFCGPCSHKKLAGHTRGHKYMQRNLRPLRCVFCLLDDKQREGRADETIGTPPCFQIKTKGSPTDGHIPLPLRKHLNASRAVTGAFIDKPYIQLRPRTRDS